MELNALEERTSARLYAYAAFQRLMGDRPTFELLEALDCDVLHMAFEVVGALPSAQERLDALADELDSAQRGLDSIEAAYDRIFIGPAALPAPPWESVYRDKKRMLMTPTTLSVREFYRTCGFEAQCLGRVPDDHIAIELDFLANLARTALDACKAGSWEEAQNAYKVGTVFLNAHLALWVQDFVESLHANDGSPFYCAVAAALATFVEADRVDNE